ncbi:MAG: hypothetical protein A2015_16260 [Spirochaetes bacterium GWF1_31_7]|nr:MAG: hypothetical protein A2Y30_13630 [Spirochaetes bacterium GWE1_32_154]OHD50003.1 MAG: hypothetical protein A2Y29_11675 [Spirochaetes bacterium GWE2_31_10]OHD52319.1 MAG: hypothetical protein A2015_16260 [Spirochaetes bacterium GWF1_31_7]OHD80352.1 MAG: hypothetical protein A2355_00190 [Spirochaetes bacterium RIFOXYB1_FULL_32_8]HBD95266.1 hypothetical protein [Spirochaetia bacterium]
MKTKKYILLFMIISNIFAYTSEKFMLDFKNDDLFKIIVRSNYKIYKNTKYFGLTSRELKGIFKVKNIDNDQYMISGDVYTIEKTIRGSMVLPNQVNSIEKSTMYFSKDGTLIERSGSLFPPIQGFPFFPENELEINDIYSGSGFFNIPLYNEKMSIDIPINFNAQYKGDSNLNGENYSLFEQSFFIDYKPDEINKDFKGRHIVKMFFDNTTGRPIYMDDRFEDQIQSDDGDIIQYKGFYLYFYNRIQSLQKKTIVPTIKIKTEDGFVNESEKGISITLNNLHFLPDSTEIVDSDKALLESVFTTLNEIKDRSFLVVGHTADTGNPEAEKKLSEERALSIAQYFQMKGIRQDKLLFTGKGALEPIASNDTEENKRKNRRVEIIILED